MRKLNIVVLSCLDMGLWDACNNKKPSDRLASNREEKKQLIDELMDAVESQRAQINAELAKQHKCPVCWLPYVDHVMVSTVCGHTLCRMGMAKSSELRLLLEKSLFFRMNPPNGILDVIKS